MISNERPSPYGRRPSHTGYSKYPPLPRKPAAEEDKLKTETLQIERKTFVFMLKENPRGRFLRVTEGAGDKRNSIIIPATGLEDFKKILDEMVKAAAEIPPAENRPPTLA